MDYRMLAVDELKRINHRKTAERIMKSRILELETRMKSIVGGSGGVAPNRGGGNKTEQKWLNLIASIGDEKKRLREVMREIKRVETVLEAVGENERRILISAYVEEKDMRVIAEREHISRATAYRMRDAALIDFTRAMFGAVVT